MTSNKEYKFVKRSIAVDAKGEVVRQEIVLPLNTRKIKAVAVLVRASTGQFAGTTPYDDSIEYDKVIPNMEFINGNIFHIPAGFTTISVCNAGKVNDIRLENQDGKGYPIKPGQSQIISIKDGRVFGSFILDSSNSETQLIYF